ncbi:catalase family protein [Mycolicibacterium obuense]|uniref:Catalase n=1 Tax=Mycolicibacterium obuense TaxID=1807 RepID=A0A0J6W7W2_9MYCO|nr:catalase family protein [Mycolicibacterium obuense]KMO77717.1 Catalase [Mycolicibacterium obuense]
MTDGGTHTFLRYEPALAAFPPGEEQLISALVADLHRNNQFQYLKSRCFAKYRRHGRPHAIRDAHAKSCAVLAGQLTVHSDLDPTLRQGMFAEPGATFDVIARISQTSGAIRSDQVRGVRGLGLKILGVRGPSGERAEARFPDDNQDFVFVTEPAFLFRDAADYAKAGMRTARILTALPDPGMLAINRVLRAVRRVAQRAGRDLPAKLRVFAEPNHHPLRQTFFTAAPVRFGDHVAKLRVAPTPATVAGAVPATIDDGHYDAASRAVASYFASKPAEYEVAVQLCTDETRMPLEDATVEWPEAVSPYRPVATIRFPEQTGYDEVLRDFADDALAFNSWRGIAEHRPLGSINRLKLRVYEASSEYRHAKNGVPPTEPTDLSAFEGAAPAR